MNLRNVGLGIGILVALGIVMLAAYQAVTSAQASCFNHHMAFVLAPMNVREEPRLDSRIVGAAKDPAYAVWGSQQGDKYCWLNIGMGWMAHTRRVTADSPYQTPTLIPIPTPTATPTPARFYPVEVIYLLTW